jgi:hypothetical protein
VVLSSLRDSTRENLKERLVKFRRFTREESQSIQYILDLLRSESTNCSYLYTKDQERDMWVNMWRGEDMWQGKVDRYMARGR